MLVLLYDGKTARFQAFCIRLHADAHEHKFTVIYRPQWVKKGEKSQFSLFFASNEAAVIRSEGTVILIFCSSPSLR